jgi:hypothetical protein
VTVEEPFQQANHQLLVARHQEQNGKSSIGKSTVPTMNGNLRDKEAAVTCHMGDKEAATTYPNRQSGPLLRSSVVISYSTGILAAASTHTRLTLPDQRTISRHH